MDMDNASLAMDMLRAATEQNEATISTSLKNTDTDTPSANPNQLPVPSEYVSQFRIDGQPILPPLMTAEKRHQMQQLRQQAVELEAKYRQAHVVRSTSTIGEQEAAASDSTSSGHSSNNNSSSSSSCCDLNNDSAMDNTQRLPHLQQTETFIYDSTRKQKHMLLDLVNSPRSRPQTLDIERKSASATYLIPTICVNPPTPQCEQQAVKQPIATCTSPTARGCSRTLSTQHRKLNNITSRILQFERTGLGRKTPLQPQPAKLLWQNEALVAADKQMLRSSTSPSLSAAQVNMTQLHRSRSFTLEQPSQALVEHMQREGKKPPIPPPLPPPPSATTATVPPAPTSPRCRFVLPANVACNSSVQSLAHLRRDTVESKAKQVQRSASASCVDAYKSPAAGRRSGGNTARQQQQQQLEQLLQRALHETHDVRVEQEQLERKQLAVAKRKMFKDIKSAHRDRFQQLVQYQHEEQRRMQEEFDRQQKFLIEQICAEINVSAYAHQPITDARSPSGISEYTSTDDLPTPSHSSPTNTVTLNSIETTPHSYAQFDELLDKDSVSNTARKRLFDVDNDDEEPMELLPPLLQSASSSPRSMSLRSRSNNSTRIKKPVQRSHSKPPGSKRVSSPVVQGKSPPARKVNNQTTSSGTKGNSRNQPQQQTISKTRRSGSPSRQTQRFVAKK
ncbi:retinoic acid-induced protein 1 isoform X2 [Drosophila montana]|uniref:retinoic acid-induced protein 1 isoform X2 n=1 Tax=Drosophila montana TaxID=40370 RepID=UPI00313B4231